jgi:ATP/maltotriose-dependent transcriptional regulator MalT
MADNSNPNTPVPNSTTAEKQKLSAADRLEQIKDEVAELIRPDKDAPAEEHREWRRINNDLSKEAESLRLKAIDEDKNLSDREKEIVKLYEQGVHNFEIARRVFEFVTDETVGRVVVAIRKVYANADDLNDIEDVESTKGYTGVPKA